MPGTTRSDVVTVWPRVPPVAVCVIAALLILGVPCIAQQRDSLVLGWAELDARNLGAEYQNAAVLVPRQLLTDLSFVNARFPGETELVVVARDDRQRTLESLRSAIAKARAARDLVALTVRDPAKRESDLMAAEAKIRLATRALENALQSEGASEESRADADETELAPLPIALLDLNRDGTLLPPVTDPVVTCAEKQLDLLVYGTVRLIGAFVAVDVVVHVAALGMDIP
ncbi:MAG: hypothetical protein JXM71_03905, partial [Spirochaetales bacterium]|nr:hypothetical protein [Spirochaetales bacterium]